MQIYELTLRESKQMLIRKRKNCISA